MNIDLSFVGHSNRSLVMSTGITENSSSFLAKPAFEEMAWKAEYHQRFQQLSLKEASEEITIPELAELEKLTRLRRAKKYPRTAEEILWQRKQSSVTMSLIESLKKYVEFHEAPRPTK